MERVYERPSTLRNVILAICFQAAVVGFNPFFYLPPIRRHFERNIIDAWPTYVPSSNTHWIIPGESLYLISEMGDELSSNKWLLNGTEIREDWRHEISVVYEHNKKLSLLEISALNDDDFGDISYITRHGDTYSFSKPYTISKPATENVHVVVPIGGLLTFNLPLNRIGEDMEFYYTVNDEPPIKTKSLFRCSQLLVVNYYRMHKSMNDLKFNEISKYNEHLLKMNVCPTPDRYGIYKFFIRRHIYNPEMNQFVDMDFQYPTVFTVMADRSVLFDNPWFNVSTISHGPLVLNETNRDLITANGKLFSIADWVLFMISHSVLVHVFTCLESKTQEVNLTIWETLPYSGLFFLKLLIHEGIATEYLPYYYLYLFQLICFFCAMYDEISTEYSPYLYFSQFTCYFFSMHTNSIFERNNNKDNLIENIPYEPSALCGILPVVKVNKTYYVYLSYSDDDLNFVRTHILPIFKRKCLRVFFRERDILPGRSDFIDSENAICQSNAFLVLATHNYINDFERNKHELPFIRQLVDGSNIPANKVLILLTGNCLFNKFAFEKYAKLPLNDVTRFQDEEEQFIESWIANFQ